MRHTIPRVLFVLTFLLALAACTDEIETTGTTTQELQQGAPRIISTGIVGVTPSGGYYRLNYGQAYQVKVIVDSGTVTYLTRLAAHNLDGSISMSPQFRDDTISGSSGTHSYTFTITPYAAGDFQVAYHIQDRGTWNVYDINPGIAVRVVIQPPHITSTTINAPIVDGRYQLLPGTQYTATVTVASGNVTYATRVEGNNNDATLGQTPNNRDATISRFSGNYTFTFYFRPTALGMYQASFRLRDLGTWNVFDVNSGVAVLVIGTAPQIVSTSIDAPMPNGRYQLTVGQRYIARVRVAAGSVANVFQVEQSAQTPPPPWANVHNNESQLWRLDYLQPAKEFLFTITPTAQGTGQLAFGLRDSPPYAPSDGFIEPGTGNAYGNDPGVPFDAVSVSAGIYGAVTNTAGLPVVGAQVVLAPGLALTTTDGSGNFQFPLLSAGTYQLAITASGYSQSQVVNIPYSGSGFRSDVKMELAFPDLSARGIVYTRYHDRSHGLTVLHVVDIPRATTRTGFITPSFSVPGGSQIIDFQEAFTTAQQNNPLVLTNGGFFDAATGEAVGYFYSLGYWRSRPMDFGGENPLTPVFGIVGNSVNQTFRIVAKTNDFTQTAATDWSAPSGSDPLWDDDRIGGSDVAYATQNDAFLNNGEHVDSWTGDYAKYWARTSVGLSSNGGIFLVIADGEGLHGIQGASLEQLGVFYRDVLQSPVSMNFDGGGSTVLLIKNGSGYRQVTTYTAENPRWSAGTNGWGVLSYLLTW